MSATKTLPGTVVAIFVARTAFAAGPAIIYDLGGKDDGSFNEAAFNGAERFKAETGAEYREFELQSDAQREQALRRFAQSGKAGFIGGMDIPLIRKFACGHVQGVKAVKPDATVFQNMTGTTGAAWNDPVKGGELTKA